MDKDFRAIYKVLKYLKSAMDYDETDIEQISSKALGISENRWLSIMEMLANDGYIEGIEIKRGAQGDRMLHTGNIRITLRGLIFLDENTQMKNAADKAKGITD